jgi:hypothetical protein
MYGYFYYFDFPVSFSVYLRQGAPCYSTYILICALGGRFDLLISQFFGYNG